MLLLLKKHPKTTETTEKTAERTAYREHGEHRSSPVKGDILSNEKWYPF